MISGSTNQYYNKRTLEWLINSLVRRGLSIYIPSSAELVNSLVVIEITFKKAVQLSVNQAFSGLIVSRNRVAR